MSVIFLLILLSILIAAFFLAGFIWAVRSGQYEDTCTPSMRLLMDDFPWSNINIENEYRHTRIRKPAVKTNTSDR